MVVIAIIAILAAISIPAYANYVIRSKLASEIGKLAPAKTAAAEYVANNGGEIDYTISDLGTVPSGSSVGDAGAVVLDTSAIVANSSISLVPTVTTGAILWTCTGSGLTSSQLPSICGAVGSSGDAGDSSGDNADSGGDVAEFDPSLLQPVACSHPMPCYSYGDDVMAITDSHIFQIDRYDGAGSEAPTGGLDRSSLNADGDSDTMRFTEFVDDTPVETQFSSFADIDNSDLSDEDKQHIKTSIDLMKSQGDYCTANPNLWACS